MDSFWIGILLISIGLGLVFLHLLRGAESVEAEGGGVLMIGPLPIVFGSSVRSAVIALLVGLAILLILVYLFPRFLMFS